MRIGERLAWRRRNRRALGIGHDLVAGQLAGEAARRATQRIIVIGLGEGAEIHRQHVGWPAQQRFVEERSRRPARFDDRFEIRGEAHIARTRHQLRCEIVFEEPVFLSRQNRRRDIASRQPRSNRAAIATARESRIRRAIAPRIALAPEGGESWREIRRRPSGNVGKARGLKLELHRRRHGLRGRNWSGPLDRRGRRR
jgi:hypothetical protein